MKFFRFGRNEASSNHSQEELTLPVEDSPETERQQYIKILDSVLRDAPHIQYEIIDLSQLGNRDPYKEGSILKDPEYARVAQELLNTFLENGTVIGWGKLPDTHRQERGDFEIMYAAGLLADFSAASLSSLSSRAGVYSQFLGHAGVPAHEPTTALLDCQITDRDFFVKSPGDGPTQPGQENLHQALSQMSSLEGYLFVMNHSYCCSTRMRGHAMPVRLTYILPPDLGAEVEQMAAKYPWVMAAVADLITDEAGQELSTTNPHKYRFPSLQNNPNIMREASMHGQSITEEFWALFSFYERE